MRRLAIARLHYCSNSFNRVRTGLAAMRLHEWRAGMEALTESPAGSELDGAARFLAAHPDVEPTVLRCASAPPGGPLESDCLGTWLLEVEQGLRAQRFDGVYLSLHGACQAEGDPVADLTVLRRLRAAIGRVPMVASFDVAANVSDEIPLLLDGSSANRNWPRGGGDESALRALDLLDIIWAGQMRPVGTLVRVPSLLASLAAPQVLPDLWDDELLDLPMTVLEASVFTGFPWSDSPLAGASCLVWTDRDTKLARQVAGKLARRLGEAGNPPALWRPDAALAAGRASGAPFVLLDPADDPMAGGAADTPGLLAALLSVHAAMPAALGVLHDPQAVAKARQAGIGGRFDHAFCGRWLTDYGAPVPLTVMVEQLVDQPDAPANPTGGLALLRHGALLIAVAEHRPAHVDLDLLRRAGIAVEAQGIVGLKSGLQIDLSLAEVLPELLGCAFPGPASADLARLPYGMVPPERRGGSPDPQGAR